MKGANTSQSDYIMLTYFIVLLLFGFLLLSSAGVAVGLERFDDAYFFIKRQLLFGFVPGSILFLFIVKINYSIWKKYASPLYITGIILLLLVFIPSLGSTNNTGVQSWINIAGFSFQPAEAAKLTMIIYMAAYLSTLGKGIENFSHGFLHALGLGIIPLVLVVIQPDIGTAFILFSVLFVMLFLAQAKMSHLSLLAGLALVCSISMILAAPYRTERLMTFLHPELDPQGQGYHINQAFLAIGSGGWFGLGLGHSRQKFQYLPEVHADSIFAIGGEELGFIIITGFLILLLLMSLRGFMIAKNSQDPFGRYLVGGIIAWFTIQSLLNIGAMVGLLPLTGVPLPFVSHGGSALMIGMVAMGVVVNVSKKSV